MEFVHRARTCNLKDGASQIFKDTVLTAQLRKMAPDSIVVRQWISSAERKKVKKMLNEDRLFGIGEDDIRIAASLWTLDALQDKDILNRVAYLAEDHGTNIQGGKLRGGISNR